MSEDDTDDRREYFRIKDRLAIEVRAISDEEFLQLENTIRYNPTQVIDKAYDMHFLKESISNDEKEKSQILSYLVMIDKKLDMLVDFLYKPKKDELFHTSYTEVEVSGNGIKFITDLVINGGDYIEIKVVIPRFPYPKITALSQVLRGEECLVKETMYCEVIARFIVINEEDRDLLINYIFVKDRERLRLKKELFSGQ
jgi:hypothetical protein